MRTDAIAASQGAAPIGCPLSPLSCSFLNNYFYTHLGLEGKLSLPTSYGLLSGRDAVIGCWNPRRLRGSTLPADGPGTKGEAAGLWEEEEHSDSHLLVPASHSLLQAPHPKWTLPSPACEAEGEASVLITTFG